MLETIILWFFAVVFSCCILDGVSGRVYSRFYRLKEKRARRLIREIIQYYAASYVKGRITKDDFFRQARRLLIKSKYHREFTGLHRTEPDRYIEECTGHTPD